MASQGFLHGSFSNWNPLASLLTTESTPPTTEGSVPLLSLDTASAAETIGVLCQWPDCAKKEIPMAVDEHKRHTEAHGRDVRTVWSPRKSCPWPDCRSKALHKTLRLFEDHLNNVHINPLVCTRVDCNYKKPFLRKSDLQRHIDNVHFEKSRLRCHFPYCEHKKKPFCRRDKWLGHIRNHHKTELCPYNHCPAGRSSPENRNEDSDKHIGKEHSVHECALMSCLNSVSQFSECGLLEHLQDAHKLTWEQVLKTRDSMKKASVQVVSREHVVETVELSDCWQCLYR